MQPKNKLKQTYEKYEEIYTERTRDTDTQKDNDKQILTEVSFL